MKTFKQLREDGAIAVAPANSMGSQGINGLGSVANVGIAGRDKLLGAIKRRRKPQVGKLPTK